MKGSTPMKKEARQSKIEQIINQYTITTQDELMAKLKLSGINVTQATLSRDIREMQIVKQPDSSGDSRYMIFKSGNQNELERMYRMINGTVTDIRQIQFINVIHTQPSYANPLAAVIDDLHLDDVAGTLAGYDTIVLFSPSVEAAKSINNLFTKHSNPDLLVSSIQD
ncbi:arginine repressor protein [Lentilactobacillus rapi DSM 19907 = JCM 15042]|nr:arginine repressor protein [Lentilactobacillus rapi DSM 19907 = JCM 15042]